MGARRTKHIDVAYSGKYVDYKGSTYQLVQTETSEKYCSGCVFYNRRCDDKLTNLCNQGFIYKKVETK